MAACSGSPAPEASNVSVDDSPTATAVADTRAATAPRVRERAPEAAAADRRAASAPATAPPSRPVPEYREVVMPAGTIVALKLASPLASDTSQIEDLVHATLREDVTLEDGSLLPAGNEVVGRVTDVERSGRVKGRARIAFRFTMLKYEGDEYDVRTEAVERMAAATKGEDATKVGIGAGAGAALGAILGGGSGAAKGAAIGAAAGTGAVLATRGEEVRLEAGEPIDTRLTAPLALRVRLR
jgi:hypothetical protein